MAAAATAAAEIAADADGGRIAATADADDDADGLTALSSSIIVRLPMVAAAVATPCSCVDSPDVDDAADEDNAEDAVEFAAAADTFETLPVTDETLFSSEPIDSSLCHLEFRAAFICVHNSFLQDLDLLIDCSQSLNWALPSGVIWNAFRADRMVLVNSS